MGTKAEDDGLRLGAGQGGFRVHVMERDEGPGEIGEDLRGGDEVGGEPLAEAELDENEKAPDEHPLEEAGSAAGEKFAGDERKRGE